MLSETKEFTYPLKLKNNKKKIKKTMDTPQNRDISLFCALTITVHKSEVLRLVDVKNGEKPVKPIAELQFSTDSRDMTSSLDLGILGYENDRGLCGTAPAQN